MILIFIFPIILLIIITILLIILLVKKKETYTKNLPDTLKDSNSIFYPIIKCIGKKCKVPDYWNKITIKNGAEFADFNTCSIKCSHNSKCRGCAGSANLWAGVEIDEKGFDPVCDKKKKCIPPVNYNKRCISNNLTNYSVPYFGYYFMGEGNFDPFTNKDRLMYFLNSQVENPVILITCGLKNDFNTVDNLIQKLLSIRNDIGFILSPYINQSHYLRKKFMNDLFIIKKICDKYKEKIVCIQTVDEPRRELASGDKPFINFEHMDEIYPTDVLKLQNKEKYVNRYFELAKDAKRDNNRQCRAHIYALYRTDIELYRDVLGPCIPLWANLSMYSKNEAKYTTRPKINGKTCDKTWHTRKLKLIDFLKDNRSITWIGFDFYYNSAYPIEGHYWDEMFYEMNYLFDETNKIQPDTYQFVPTLQSNNYTFKPWLKSTLDTCNLGVEEKVKDWNRRIIAYTSTKFPLNPHFPRFPMFMTFALDSPQKGHEHKAAGCFKASPNINYLQETFSNS